MIDSVTLDDLLMAHAAGRLDEPVGLVVATHLAISQRSRGAYRAYETLGGVLFETLDPEPLGGDALERTLARLDREAAMPLVHPPCDDGCRDLPPPLRPYAPDGLDALPWRQLGPVAEAPLPVASGAYRTRLIRLRAGRAVPRHTHEGMELTLVLDGAFSDGHGRYDKGDLVIADRSIDHQPRAEDGRDCLCLAVTDAPLRLTGRFSRLLNPFMNF